MKTLLWWMKCKRWRRFAVVFHEGSVGSPLDFARERGGWERGRR